MLQELILGIRKFGIELSLLYEFLELVQPEQIILIGFGCHVFVQEGDETDLDSSDFQILEQ